MFVMRSGAEHHHRQPALHAASHDYAVVAFYVGGSVTMEQRGNWSLREGDVLLIPAGEPHRSIEFDRPDVWGLGFCVSCLVSEGAALLLEPFERVRSGGSPVVRIPEARRTFLASLFAELRGEASSVEEDSAAIQRSLLTLILAEVRRAAAWQPQVESPSDLVTESLRFIERSCLGRLSLQDVAAAVHRSPAHVTTALKRATGKSAVEWIIAGRLAEARRRLLHSDEMVDVIAERIGYADPTHFIRLFRRAHGLTPAAWRAKHRTTPPR